MYVEQKGDKEESVTEGEIEGMEEEEEGEGGEGRKLCF